MTPEKFQKLLSELLYLNDAEKAMYYSMYVAGDDAIKKQMVDFFLSQKQKSDEIGKNLEKKIAQAKAKFDQTLQSLDKQSP